MKRCSKCRVEKSEAEFFNNKSAPDGLSYQCKVCHSEAVDRNRKAKRDQYREYDRRWRAENRERVREQKRRTMAAYRARPEKEAQLQAHHALAWAVKSGKIIRPAVCDDCGAEGRVEGHHADYDRPFDVSWLCKRCHTDKHMVVA